MPAVLLYDLKRAVVLDPKNAEARFQLAEALFGEGDIKGAVQHLEKALELDAEHANARRLLVKVYEKEGQPEKSARLLRDRVLVTPSSPAAREEMAEHYLTLGRADDALLQLEEAARLEPGNTARLARLAEMYGRIGHAERALELYEQLLVHIPGDRRAVDEVAALRLELGAPDSERFLRLAPALQFRELAGQPAFAAALESVRAAAEAFAQGDFARTRRELVAAPPATRALPVFDWLRGELAWAEGDTAKAETLLSGAASKGLAPARLRLGDLRHATGRIAEAKAAWADVPGDLAAVGNDRIVALDRWQKAEARTKPGVGRISALGWNPHGGHVSPLEAVAVAGNSALHLSGNVGSVMKEAADVAFSCLKAQAEPLRIASLVRDHDLHLHFTDTEFGKDGPSAGLALVLAGISAYTRRPIHPFLAATGEITLSGAVKPVGGIHEKCVAAALHGVRVILHPRRNTREVGELPKELAGRIRLIAVDDVSEATTHAFTSS